MVLACHGLITAQDTDATIPFLNIADHQKLSMKITRGLAPNIANFTDLEQKLIVDIAKKLRNNGYPLNQLTRVHLKNKIRNVKDYYAYNEITFLINPKIYKKGDVNLGIQNIGVDWEDPAVIRTADGGIEFQLGSAVQPEDLMMNLYRLEDSYASNTLSKEYYLILQNIHDVLITAGLKEIEPFASKGIPALIKNYHIALTADTKNNRVYEMSIRRLEEDLIDVEYFHKLYKQYQLKINLETSSVEIESSFDPTFFPTPVSASPN
ncbi:hypothetical protein BD809_105259 [Aquimarina intermedia]|uniref:Uncharacterized protein n=2 Tax=Aquimarina intermedia TaxID=350814 RepID=A0A5S5C4Z3_9FLAO|nr:hypothetical protein BD809_105259 [Aquimarina intermedia]